MSDERPVVGIPEWGIEQLTDELNCLKQQAERLSQRGTFIVGKSLLVFVLDTLKRAEGFAQEELKVRQSSYLPTPNDDEKLSLRDAGETLAMIQTAISQLEKVRKQ